MSKATKRASKANIDRIREAENLCKEKYFQSRIPVPVRDGTRCVRPLKRKISAKSVPVPNTSITTETSVLPGKSYCKDRTRVVSNYVRRPKSGMESEISIQYRKYKLEKTNLIEQQLNFKKEYEEMKALLEKLKNVGDQEVILTETESVRIDSGGAGDALVLLKKFEDGDEISDVRLFIQEQTGTDLSTVHHKCMNANAEIFNLLKRLGDKAVQLYCHQIKTNSENRGTDDTYLFQNVLELKSQFIQATNEGNDQFLEYEKEINKLKVDNLDLQEKLTLAEQRLVTQEAANNDINLNREKSFGQIEQKLRDIIVKFQSQFKMQKSLQEKTEVEVETLRSKHALMESDNSKLNIEVNECKRHLDDCEKIIVTLEGKVSDCSKENEELLRKYEQELEEMQNKICCLEFELEMEAKAHSASNLTNLTKISQLTDNVEQLQLKLFDYEGEICNMEMLLTQKSNEISELSNSKEDSATSKENQNLREELNAERTMVKRQNERILKLQNLLAVREVLIHTLKLDRLQS